MIMLQEWFSWVHNICSIKSVEIYVDLFQASLLLCAIETPKLQNARATYMSDFITARNE